MSSTDEQRAEEFMKKYPLNITPLFPENADIKVELQGQLITRKKEDQGEKRTLLSTENFR